VVIKFYPNNVKVLTHKVDKGSRFIKIAPEEEIGKILSSSKVKSRTSMRAVSAIPEKHRGEPP